MPNRTDAALFHWGHYPIKWQTVGPGARCAPRLAFSSRGVVVSSTRIRVSGVLSRGRRGMILTTTGNEIWIVESEQLVDDLINSKVIVEGTITGMDRLRADWIGAESHPS